MSGGNIKLNLKEFKHVKTDKDSTTLQHKAGHQLVLAHNALSPEAQQQLKALSGISQDAATPEQKQEAKMAKGGNPKLEESKKIPPKPNYDEGGLIDQASQWYHKQAAAGTFGSGPQATEQGNTMNSYKDHPENRPVAKAQGGKICYDGGGMVDKAVDAVQNFMSPIFHSTEQDQQKYQDPASRPVFNGTLESNNPNPPSGRHTVHKAQGGSVRNMYAGGDADIQANPDQVMTPAPAPIDKSVADIAQHEKQKEYQKTYNEAYDSAKQVSSTMNNLGYGQRTGLTPFSPIDTTQEEINANKFASNAVKIKQEDEQQVQAGKEAQNAELAKLNAQRDQIGLPPIPGTPTMQLASAGPAVQQDTPQPDQSKQDQQQPAPQQKPDSYDPESVMHQSYQNQISAQRGMGQAQAKLGGQEADILQQDVQARQQAQNAFQNQYIELENERQNHMHDIQNGYIDPEKYWDNHSKIASGIGMILAGFNPTNSPNAAVEFLKTQMNRDLDAQKTNLNQKNNLLSANLQQFHNLRDAADMTRVMQADKVVSDLKSAAAKAQQGGMAQLAAQDAIGKIQASFAPQFQQFAMRRALMGLAGGGGSPQSVGKMFDYMDAMNPGSAKDWRDRYVAGIGMSDNAVPPATREKIGAFQNVDRMMGEVQNFNAQHPNAQFDPKARAAASTLMNQLSDSIRQAADQGVYKESEANFMKNTIGDSPASFMHSFTSDPKIAELRKQKQADYQTLLHNAGFHPQAPQAQQQAPQTKELIPGVHYQKVQGGWKKVQ